MSNIKENRQKEQSNSSNESDESDRLFMNKDLLNTKSEGLSSSEVKERRASGYGNEESQLPAKSTLQIIFEHIVTPFNILNLFLALVVFVAAIDQPKYLLNTLFLGVAIVNTISSLLQELKARKEVKKLSLLSQPKVIVIRDGIAQEVGNEDLVLGDMLELHTENQLTVDAVLAEGINFEVDESLLTGESDSIYKQAGDQLLAGCFVVSGRGFAVVNRTGSNTYAAKINIEAKQIRQMKSEIMQSLNKIIKTLSFAIVVVGISMLVSKLLINPVDDWRTVVVSTVAALVGMIPEGLVLLTSVAFVVGVIRLSKNNVLVQELSSIETLARIDTLCVDKTGTITSGKMRVIDVHMVENEQISSHMGQAIGYSLQALDDRNNTSKAILDHFVPDPTLKDEYTVTDYYSFSSEKKWSGVHFEEHGTWILGASEIILNPHQKKDLELLKKRGSEDRRIIAVVKSEEKLSNSNELPDNLQIVCFIEIEEELRQNAQEIFDYCEQQGVEIKIISGDNPKTVQAIAKQAGVKQLKRAIDMSDLPEDADFSEIVEEYQLFGRVTPFQKKELIIALQKNGHNVAMVGDGVNDVPALKQADVGVALAQGSDATRASSNIVLMDNDLSTMIPTVYEGRRVINNIERVAVLFLTKTVYMSLLAFFFIFLPEHFPLFPIQMTLIGSGLIGIPGFFLSLIPNRNVVSGDFLKKVYRLALPAGITATLAVLLHQLAMYIFKLPEAYHSTISLFILLTVSLIVLWKTCQPFSKYTIIIWLFSVLIVLAAILFFPEIFFLTRLDLFGILYSLFFIILIPLLMSIILFINKRLRRFHVRSKSSNKDLW